MGVFLGHAHTVDVPAGRERLALGVKFSSETMERGRALSRKMHEAFDLAVKSLEDPDLARRVIDMKAEVQDTVSDIVEYLSGRLAADAPNRAVLYRLESQLIELIQREYYFAKKIAKEVVREAEASIADSVLTDEMTVGST